MFSELKSTEFICGEEIGKTEDSKSVCLNPVEQNNRSFFSPSRTHWGYLGKEFDKISPRGDCPSLPDGNLFTSSGFTLYSNCKHRPYFVKKDIDFFSAQVTNLNLRIFISRKVRIRPRFGLILFASKAAKDSQGRKSEKS